ncbi:MAG TPA: SCP2 sterol-binding domain-containing protein [Rhizomicrobium sp.]|nr:SCP2 sterol-binding domain-containing protein [Rhizomicrobium sp.]
MENPAGAQIDNELLARRGRAEGLGDVTGDLRLQIEDDIVGILHVENGTASIQPNGDATALIRFDTPDTLLAVLGGGMNSFVAYLQGRLRLEGDRALAIRVLFGLRAGSPWTDLAGVKPHGP